MELTHEPAGSLPVERGGVNRTGRTLRGLVAVAIVITVLFALLGGVGGFVGTAAANQETLDGMEGEGTEGTPYVITNATELQAMNEELSAHYELGQDINADEIENFEPVGNSSDPFTGTFDGEGYTISDLTIDRGGEDDIGLFGNASGSTIENVVIEDVSIVGNGHVGGLVGSNVGGTIQNVSVSGTIVGPGGYVGGLVGDNDDGAIHNSSTSGSVESEDSYTGGLVGYTISGPIENSSSTSDVTYAGSYGLGTDIGGLVGFIRRDGATIYNSSASGNVDAVGANYVGGLVGLSGTYVRIEDSYATGNVEGWQNVGGLVGSWDGELIANTFATGAVTDGNNVGGLIGDPLSSVETVENSYWDTETSGQTDSIGGTGLTTAQMTGANATESMAGFDFDDTWATTDEYPHLQREVEGLTLDLAEMTVALEETTQTTVTLTFVDGSTVTATKTANYTSDNESVATVAENGTVTAVAEGTANVTATAVESDSLNVTVLNPANLATNTSMLNFEDVEVGTNTSSETVHIENIGGLDLNLTTTSILGVNASEFAITNGNVTPTVTLQTDDTHNVTLAFEPGSIGSKSANLTIESNDPDQPMFNVLLSGTGEDTTDPVSDAGGDRTVDEDDQRSFNGSASTDNGQLVSYEWEFGDGGTATGENVSYTYTEPDTYTLNLTVTDAAENNHTDVVEVTVTDTTPPAADAGPDLTGMLNDEVQFNGSNSTDNVGVDSWEWDFGDGSTNATVEAPTHSYDTGGTYTVTLTVVDTDGNADVDTVNVTVAIDECTVISESGNYRLAANLSSDDDCIVIESSDVTFDGMGHTIEYDGDFFASGVLVGDTTSPNNVTVTNVTVDNWSAAGVTYENVDEGEISNVMATVGEVAIGIEVSDQSTGNLLKDNEVTGSGEEGIIISGSSDDTILRDNEVNGPNYGISVLDATGVNITSGNVVTATTTYGVRIWQGSDNARISDTNLSGVDGSGVSIRDSNGVTVENSNISANTLGIELEIADGSTLSNNTVSDNADSTDGHGIYLWDSGSSLMANNTVGNNTGDGIRLESSSTGATIQDNEVKNNDLGISIDTSATNPTLTNNTVVDSAGRGIESQADNTALTNNVIQDGEDHGIWLSGSSNVLTNNTASDNAGDGIAIQTFASSYTLSNNSANDNDGTGIHFSGDGGHDVDGLTANGNTVGVGVGVASDANTVENVTANDNAEYGVQIDDAVDNTLTNVTAQSNGLWDFYAEDGSRTDVTDLDVGSTVASFEAFSVSLSGVDSTTAAPTGFERIGGSLNASATAIDGWLDLTLPYAGATDDFEASLRLWRHDGSDWSEMAGSSVDTDADTVSANVTSFSTFAIIGGPSEIGVNTTTLDHGAVEIATNTSSRTVAIENNGTVDLNLTATTIAGANASEFAITGGNISSTETLEPGDTHEVTVEFEPNEHIGAKTANLTIENNGPDDPTVNVTLNGTGVDTTAPVADAGSNLTVDEDGEVNFDGSNSTDNGVISYQWETGDDGLESGAEPTYTYDEPGTYVVNLTVTDAAGNEDTDSLVVTVEDMTAPTVDAGPDRTVGEDDEISFNGSNSTDNVGIDTYEWEFGDGNTSTGATANHTYPSPGTYTVNLTANDSAGNDNTASVVVTVNDTTDPTADAGANQTIDEDEELTFDGSNTTDNGVIDTYEWAFGDGNTSTGETTDHTYVDPGVYTANLTVTDDGGNNATDSAVVTVNDTTKPTAAAGDNQTVTEGQSVSFDGTNSTDNGGIDDYAWEFGDGANDTGANPTHTYTQPGTYVVNLTVTDGADHNATDSVTVTVEAEPSNGGGGSPPVIGGGDDDDGDDGQPGIDLENGEVTIDVGDEVVTLGIGFGDGDASGSVTVESLDGLPEDVDPLPDGVPGLALVDVTVPSDLTDSAATLQLTLNIDSLGGHDPADLVVYHYADGEWTALETTVETTDGEIVIEAETPGFSVFAVGPSAQQTTPDDGTETPEPATPTPDDSAPPSEPATSMPDDGTPAPDSDGPPIVLVVLGALVLLVIVVALFALARRES